MAEADAYRRLAAALEDLELWTRLAPLLPFAVHHDHLAARAAERSRRLSQIPTQRTPAQRARPVVLWPVPQAGNRRIQLPRRAQ